MLLVLATLAWPAARAAAQSVDDDCSATIVHVQFPDHVPPGWSDLHPDRILATQMALIGARRWVAVAETIETRYTAERMSWPPAYAAVVAAQVDTLLRDLAHVDQPWRKDRFDLLVDQGHYVLFPLQPDGGLVIDATLDPFVRRSLCWHALSLQGLIRFARLPADSIGVAVLSDRVQQWTNYDHDGFSAFPWEHVINNQFRRRSFVPPAWQLVVAHPSAGVELSGVTYRVSTRTLSATPAVWLEAIGAIGYVRSRTAYYGMGLLLTIPQDGGLGVGPNVHVYRFSIGYVFRSHTTRPARQQGVVLSMDLYHLFSK